MRPPIFVRALSEWEHQLVKAHLRPANAVVLRRCQTLLLSARGERVPAIADALSCDEQTARNTIHAFNAKGGAVLCEGSSRPHRLRTAFSAEQVERLRDLLHRSPRDYDKPTSVWTLELAAKVCFEQAITPSRVTGETIRLTLKRMGIRWKRAKHWITSHDPDYVRKKKLATA